MQPLEILVFKQIGDFLAEFETILILKSVTNETESFDHNDSSSRLQSPSKGVSSEQALKQVELMLDQFLEKFEIMFNEPLLEV